MMNKVRFTKMHGLGNDFVVLDTINQKIALTPEKIQLLANRHLGVGCDQVLLVQPSTSADSDFIYRIFNADGTEAEQCGNGARCFVRFVYDNGLTQKKELRLQTKKGIISTRLEQDGQVTVNMGKPIFIPHLIPFLREEIETTYTLMCDGQPLICNVLSMGNPHAVLFVESIAEAPVQRIGSALQAHPIFPEKVNVGFAQVLKENYIKLRVFERGVGETLSCGTGACAAVVAGIQRNLLSPTTVVETRGGKLTISWPEKEGAVLMTGPAKSVFQGEMLL